MIILIKGLNRVVWLNHPVIKQCVSNSVFNETNKIFKYHIENTNLQYSLSFHIEVVITPLL